MLRFIASLQIFLIVLFGLVEPACAMPDTLYIMLAKYMRFSIQDLNAVARGELIAKPIETHSKKELAFFGITYVNAPPSLLLQRFRDIENFKTGEAVLKIKKLSDPPSREEFKEITLEEEELREIKKCRIGKCDMKLSAEMIKRFQSEVNWEDKNRNATVTALYQDILFQYVRAYLATGNSALLEYYDQKKPVPLSKEFEAALSGSPYLRERIPEMYQYLANYPHTELQNVENYLYWSKETLKFRPVISVTHVSMYRRNPKETVFASKQIYANHYLTGSLALTIAISESDDPNKPGFFLLYINRSRTDLLGGLLSGLKRTIARSKSTTALEENMQMIKDKLEKEWQAR